MQPVWIAFCGLAFTVISALLAAAYQMGRLSQRVDNVENLITKEAGTHDEVIVLKTQMKTVLASMEQIKRGMDGVQRQLGNLAGLKGNTLIELGGGSP